MTAVIVTPSEVQKVVDVFQEFVAATADHDEIIAIAIGSDRAEALGFHEFGEADDGIERRPQLMAQAGQEPGFRRIGGRRHLELVGQRDRQVGELPILLFKFGQVADNRGRGGLPVQLKPSQQDLDRHHFTVLAHSGDASGLAHGLGLTIGRAHEGVAIRCVAGSLLQGNQEVDRHADQLPL